MLNRISLLVAALAVLLVPSSANAVSPAPTATPSTAHPVARALENSAAGRSAASTTRADRKKFVLLQRPRVAGTKRFTHILTASAPRFDVKPTHVSYRWLRNGHKIPGATHRTYRLSWRDVGRRVRVKATVNRPGYVKRSAGSKGKRIMHRVPTRRTVFYTVQTRGRITANFRDFKRLANASLNDPRGWRGASGIEFREVRRGGTMTLVLAEPSWVPRFSSGCSSRWSCRVGRYVIINQMRWQHASPAWNGRGGSLRDYRHMVVNHETGHWLGWSHRSCPGQGALAPVMQQQSINLQGCRFNPFPTPAERNVPRF